MGRGNVYVTGSYEGLFYIDNDDLQVWRKDGPDGKEPEIRMMADISLDELVADDWYVDEIESSYKEEDVLRCFCAELRKLCPSFQPAANSNVWLGNERRVILEMSCFTSVWRTTSGRWPSSLSRKTATPTVKAHGWPAFRNGAIGNTSITLKRPCWPACPALAFAPGRGLTELSPERRLAYAE